MTFYSDHGKTPYSAYYQAAVVEKDVCRLVSFGSGESLKLLEPVQGHYNYAFLYTSWPDSTKMNAPIRLRGPKLVKAY